MYLYPDDLTARATLWLWTLREYPATTETQALLSRLGDRRGVTLHIYCRTVSPSEENRIIHNAANRNRLERTNTNDLRRMVTAESNLQDMTALLGTLDAEHELDELYLWLSNPVAIEYIRNCLKRVRKRDSALLMASQNLEDFDQEGVRELTKPLFAIPPHQFLFDPGTVRKQSFMEMLRLEETEFDLISRAQRGECLFRCGSERYMLQVHAPAYKEKLFGTAGGR